MSEDKARVRGRPRQAAVRSDFQKKGPVRFKKVQSVGNPRGPAPKSQPALLVDSQTTVMKLGHRLVCQL